MSGYKFIISVLVLTSGLLTGCTVMQRQIRPMEEYTGESPARLRVISDPSSFVAAIPGKNCMDWGTKGAGVVYGNSIAWGKGYRGKSLNMPSPPSAEASTYSEFYIAGDKPIVLEYKFGDGHYTCDFALSFTPKGGKDYEAYLYTNNRNRTCGANIKMLGQNSEPVQVLKAENCEGYFSIF